VGGGPQKGCGGRKRWAMGCKHSGVWCIREIEAIKALASMIKGENIKKKKHTKGPNDSIYRRLGPFACVLSSWLKVSPITVTQDASWATYLCAGVRIKKVLVPKTRRLTCLGPLLACHMSSRNMVPINKNIIS
jgi:hypothetical protein